MGSLLFSPVSQATTYGVMGGISKHVNVNPTYTYKGVTRNLNEANFTIGLATDEYRTVFFRNSYYKWSLASMRTPRTNVLPYTDLGLRLGAALGYIDTPENLLVAPIVGLESRIGTNGFYGVLGCNAVGVNQYVLTLHFEIEL